MSSLVQIHRSRSCRRLRALPHLHRKIIARGGNARPIGRPGYSIYAVRMAAIGADKVAGSSIPDLYTLIGASGGDARPIGRPGCRDYISSMAPVGQDKPAAARIPHLDEIVPASRGDARPIGRPGQGIHLICMTAKYQIIIALTLLKSIPDLYSPVPGSGGNMATIRRPHYSLYQAITKPMGMSKVSEGSSAVGGIPDLHGLIFTSRGDELAIG